MIVQTLNRLAGVALDQLYPPQCALCEKHGPFLCDACRAALPRAEGPRCDVCWLPSGVSPCATCAAFPPALTSLRSVFRYEGKVRELVHAFKFGRMSVLGRPLAAQLAGCYRLHSPDADVIVPVPLSTSRKRDRGFNQAELMAREVARDAGVPWMAALERRGHSRSQASSSSAEQRRLNVEGVFRTATGVDVSGLRVLLIDDVATTGSTLNACAALLLAAGAGEVSGLTLARED
jgi:ComF family protein